MPTREPQRFDRAQDQLGPWDIWSVQLIYITGKTVMRKSRSQSRITSFFSRNTKTNAHKLGRRHRGSIVFWYISFFLAVLHDKDESERNFKVTVHKKKVRCI